MKFHLHLAAQYILCHTEQQYVITAARITQFNKFLYNNIHYLNKCNRIVKKKIYFNKYLINEM